MSYDDDDDDDGTNCSQPISLFHVVKVSLIVPILKMQFLKTVLQICLVFPYHISIDC